MARIEKTVFVSYRRTDEPWALAVFGDLTHRGYDVFVDYDGIASGHFETVIFENIRARAHFLVLLTPTALERCRDPKDWMRREIEAALDSRRNVVPLMLAGFDFDTPDIASQLTGKMVALKEYNGLEIPRGYFPQAMERLRDKFLNVPVDAVLHPASDSAQLVAQEQKDKATMALGEARHQPGLSPEERRKLESLDKKGGEQHKLTIVDFVNEMLAKKAAQEWKAKIVANRPGNPFIDITQSDERHRLEWEFHPSHLKLKLDGLELFKYWEFGNKTWTFQIGAHSARFHLKFRLAANAIDNIELYCDDRPILR